MPITTAIIPHVMIQYLINFKLQIISTVRTSQLCYYANVGQLVSKDIEFWGLSKICFKQNILENTFKDEQTVSHRTKQSYNFEDKYFQGSVNINKSLKSCILESWRPTVFCSVLIPDLPYLSIKKPGNLFPINDHWPGVYISPFRFLYRRLFTLECWTPTFIRAQAFIWALLLFR